METNQRELLLQLWNMLGVKTDDLPPIPVDADKQQEAIKLAIKQLKTSPVGGLCSYAWIDVDAQVKLFTYQACYIKLSYEAHQKPLTYFVDLGQRYSGWSSRELTEPQRRYFHWILNDSVYADAHIVKDADEAWKNGTVVDVRKAGCAEALVSGQIAIRYMWEFPAYIDDCVLAVDQGLTWEQAILFIHAFSSRNRNQWVHSDRNVSGSHGMFALKALTKIGVDAFLNKDKSFYSKCTQIANSIKYTSLAKAFGGKDSYYNQKWNAPNLINKTTKSVWGGDVAVQQATSAVDCFNALYEANWK